MNQLTNIYWCTIRGALLGTLALAMLFITACSEDPAAPRDPNDVLGEWEIAEGGSIVKLRRCGEDNQLFCGQLSWMEKNHYAEDDPRAGELKTDRSNPDESQRDKPLLGIDLLHNFRWDGEQNRWVDGEIYNPFDGQTYQSTLEIEGEKKLKIRGYVGLPILGMTIYWERPKQGPAERGGYFADQVAAENAAAAAAE